MLKRFPLVDFWLLENYDQGAPQKELVVAIFIGRFKTGTLRKFLTYFIFVDFLLIEGYEEGAQRKELINTTFIEQFKATTLRKS